MIVFINSAGLTAFSTELYEAIRKITIILFKVLIHLMVMDVCLNVHVCTLYIQ